jgi:hypothetical protein
LSYFRLGVNLIRKTLTSGAHLSATCPRRSHPFRALSGPRASVPTAIPTASPAIRAAPRCHLTSRALVPTALSSVSEADRRCLSTPPSLSDRLRHRELIHGEQSPSPLLPHFLLWNVESSSLSLLPVAGPPPATGALASSENAAAYPVFLPSPSTWSSGELSPPPPCSAGSLSAVGARAPSFAPPPSL